MRAVSGAWRECTHTHTHTRVRCQDAISRLKWPTSKPNSVLVTRRGTAMSLPSPLRDRPYKKRQHSRAADHVFEDDLRWWSDERFVDREDQSRTEELSSSRPTLRESQKLPTSTSSRTFGGPDHDARETEPFDFSLQGRKKTRFALPEEVILQGEGTAYPRHAVGHRTASAAHRELEPRNEPSRREGSSSHKYKGASPIVLSCARCRRILGDSLGSSGGGRDGVEGRDDEAQIRHDLGFVVLTRITPIVRIHPDLQMVVEEHRPDVGSTFVALFCACGSRVGRKYWTTPKNLDSVRDRYALSISQISVYQLGVADSAAERERPREAWKSAAEASLVQPQVSRGVHGSPRPQQQRENKYRPRASIVMQQGHVPPHMTARDPHDVPERHRVDFELDELIDELERSSDDNNDQDRRSEEYMRRPFKVAAPQVRSNTSGNNKVKKEAPRSPSRVRERNFSSPSYRRSEKDNDVSTFTVRKVKRERSLSPIRFRGYSSDDGSSDRETSKKGREEPKVRRLGSLKNLYD